MICPECAREVPPEEGRCPFCSQNLAPARAGHEEETPVPASEGPSEADHTLLADKDRTLVAEPGATAPGAATDRGPLDPGQDFGSRYHIIKLLGMGGMGAVYQAWDKELEVLVALKVVRPEAAADPDTARELDRRFKRELLLAREVTHKNVVRIHDLGEIEGIKYITMSYIEGENLATILDHQSKLPVPEALRIARAVVSGMVAAHEAGVVHRDLKPANIMVNSANDEALIMDFGIARSAVGPSGEAVPGVELAARDLQRPELGKTMAGAIVGTLEYMAPEQFGGEVADQRSDLYTFGLILYDMLLGRRRARHAQSAIAEVQERAALPPPSARSLDPEVPEALDQIISRCLQPDPLDRYQKTADLEAELRRLDDQGHPLPIARRLTRPLIGAAAVLAAAMVATTWWLARTGAPTATPEPMSVLIADFENRAAEPSFDGAVEQALTISMEGAAFVSAYPRANAQRIVQQLQPDARLDETMARLVSRREGVDVILAGSIARDGTGYEVSVRALDPALDPDESRPLASARAAADSKDEVLPAIGRLAADLRRRLGDTAPKSVRLAAAETFTAASLEAMKAYALGQELAVQGRFEEALVAYEEAVSHDPEFGRAYAGMGTVYGNLRQEDKAEESYKKALRYSDRMSERERYRTLGTYYLLVARNYEKAIENYQTLVQLYPADGAAHANLALAYLNTRSFDKAFLQGRRALDLDPDNVIKRMNYAMYAMYAGDFETSMAESKSILEENPSFGYALLTLARSAVASGDLETARESYEELAGSESLGASLAPLGQADLAMYLGRHREAADTLRASLTDEEPAATAAPKLVALAEALEALGETAAAERAAQRAAELSGQESVLFPAARVMIAVGDVDGAESIAAELENMLQSQTAAYARLIAGEIGLENQRLLEAIEALRDGWQRHDSWFAHFLLGRAYLEAERYPEALGELQICLARTGEATDLFLVDGATIRYLPPVYYWLATAQEGLGSVEAARDNYQRFLELRQNADTPDPLAADAKRRLESL